MGKNDILSVQRETLAGSLFVWNREALLNLPYIRDFREMRRKALQADKLLGEFDRGVEVSDHNFRCLFPDLVKEAESAAVETPGGTGQTWTKRRGFRVRPSSGLTAYQSFILELACLSRLARHTPQNEPRRFPAITEIDWDAHSFKTSDAGITLDVLEERIEVSDLDAQIDDLIALLESSGVLHLDLNPFGQPKPFLALKNIAVNRQGIISLIDFDIASIDGVCIGPYVYRRWKAVCERGGLATLGSEIRHLVRSHRAIAVTS